MKIRKSSMFWFILITAWIVGAPPVEMNLDHLLATPRFPSSFLGTDAFGRDLFAALGEAMGRSLLFSFVATSLSLIAGFICGAWLGMRSGRSGFPFERALDFFLAFPSMLLVLFVQAIVGTGWTSLSFSVAFGLFPGIARFVSSRAKEITVADYVESARALGGRKTGIFFRHYIPELLAYSRIKLPSLAAQALLLEATLSFLNLGVSPGVLSWGSLLAQSKNYLVEAPHLAWATGIPLVLTLLAFQRAIDEPENRIRAF